MVNIGRNISGVVVGLLIGSAVNMSLIMLGPSIVPPPPGVDVTDPDSLSASMHLFEPKHFVVPFAAHALGTFAGAVTAFYIAATRRSTMSLIVGVAFLAGGIAASQMIPAPTWFIVTDLLFAYIPMAWLGSILAMRVSNPGGAGSLSG